MTFGEWILAFMFILLSFALGLIYIVTKWDSGKLERENEKLKEDLKKARARKVKNEYKKVKEVK